MPGVPLMRCLRPNATLRCRTEVSHCGLSVTGVPFRIQSRQALVLSFAHQIAFDYSVESAPRIG